MESLYYFYLRYFFFQETISEHRKSIGLSYQQPRDLIDAFLQQIHMNNDSTFTGRCMFSPSFSFCILLFFISYLFPVQATTVSLYWYLGIHPRCRSGEKELYTYFYCGQQNCLFWTGIYMVSHEELYIILSHLKFPVGNNKIY